MLPNLVPPKIPDGERVDFDVSKIPRRFTETKLLWLWWLKIATCLLAPYPHFSSAIQSFLSSLGVQARSAETLL